jgi:DNA replication and repair protein RecF
MLLSRLTLHHFRNYQHLELSFDTPLTLLQGQNAQGKTNLLEAIFMLATSKAVHAGQEREIAIEVLLTQRGDLYTKQVKINGAARRALDLVGLLRAVLFLPADIQLVDGGPGERRHYLDVALCQLDRGYCRALAAFQQVLQQRNSLLKRLREQAANPAAPAVDAQLAFWDEKLAQQGAAIVVRRQAFLQELAPLAAERHRELSGQREALSLHYLPSFNPGGLSDAEFERARDGLWVPPPCVLDPAGVSAAYLRKLASRRSREVAAGVTLYGPQRDDLRFEANGRDLRTYGSRGQQRSAALALKLAEVQVMAAAGSAPLLLLDDVMSGAPPCVLCSTMCRRPFSRPQTGKIFRPRSAPVRTVFTWLLV